MRLKIQELVGNTMSFANRKLHMLRSNDGKNQEIWVSADEWMRPRDIISEGSEILDELLSRMLPENRYTVL